MKLRNLAVTILILLFVGLSGWFGNAYAAGTISSFILPNPIFAFQANPINELNVNIWAGDFSDGHTAADVDLGSILVNGNLVPASIEITQHNLFTGDALKINVSITEFLPGYGILWDATMQNYTVEGMFNDESSFSISGEFKAIGHTSGDLNGDNRVNIGDLNFMVENFFRGGPAPLILQASDMNGSCGNPDMNDLSYLINYIYRGGPTPLHCNQQ